MHKMIKKTKIALIADEATVNGLSSVAHLIQLTPRDWLFKLALYKPDFLLVESFWRGYRNSWQGKGGDFVYAEHHPLCKIIQYCQRHDIPTVFWNKEDPLHFERFSELAKLFDQVYTTDINCVGRYNQLDNRRFQAAKVLMFAAPAQINKSTSNQTRLNNIVFLGGYYGDEIPARSREQALILSALSEHDLLIYDRFWTSGKCCSFPNEIAPFCLPAVSVKQAYQLYSRYQLYINFNSIQHSNTMLSRRVFELAACASPIISTPSQAITAIFGELIPQVSTQLETQYWATELQSNSHQRCLIAKQLQQIVFDQHTWSHRLQQIITELP